MASVTQAPVGSFDVRSLRQGLQEQPPHVGMFTAQQGSTEALICRAVSLGDFEAAVDVCLSQEMYADAMMLGVAGGCVKALLLHPAPSCDVAKLRASSTLPPLSFVPLGSAPPPPPLLTVPPPAPSCWSACSRLTSA